MQGQVGNIFLTVTLIVLENGEPGLLINIQVILLTIN